MITMDNTVLSEIDRDGFARRQEEKRAQFNFLKPKELNVKAGKKGKISKRLARKTNMHDAKMKTFMQQQAQLKRKTTTTTKP